MLCPMFRWPVLSVLAAAGVVVGAAAGVSGSGRPGPGAAGPSGDGRPGLVAVGAQALAWSVVPSPNRGAGGNVLNGLTCTSAAACTAVGFYTASNGGRALIESWDGARWSLVPSPQPGTDDGLNGVSCVPAGTCMAVGTYARSGSSARKTLVESWDGTRWSVVPSPNPRLNFNFLLGVSCASATACTAVGYYSSGGPTKTLVESWDGTGWSVVPSPSPGSSQNQLDGVSCASATACTAVGYYFNSGLPKTLVESWDGANWSVVPSPSPGSNDSLDGVSCISVTACTAVGSYNNSSSPPKNLIESWDGTRWSQVPSPQPGTISNGLSGVSCISAASCAAVGFHENKFGIFKTLVESWDGTRWSVTPSPDPALLDHITGVSCASATACTAAGYTSAGSGHADRTLIASGTASGAHPG